MSRSPTDPASTAPATPRDPDLPGPRPFVTAALAGMALVAVVALLCLPGPASAQGFPPGGGSSGAPAGGVLKHEPVFGIGPQTIWKGGIGAGVETHFSRHASPDGGRTEEELELHAHLDYGVTENLTLRVAMPLVKRKTETVLVPGTGSVSSSATGVGDLLVRGKYRLWHRFSGSTQYHASVVGGAEFPTGATTTQPSLSPGGTDYLAGATVSRDGLRYYLWASGIARMNGGVFAGSRENEYRYDAAVGWRPWVPSFTGADPLLLLEFNGVTVTEGGGHGCAEPATALLGKLQPRADAVAASPADPTGARTVVDDVRTRPDVAGGGEAGPPGTRTILAVSPAFWLTYRYFAFKGGVKLPVYQDVGAGMKLDYALVAELEIHVGG